MSDLRSENAAQSGDQYDLLVIGGGINGVGVARDAAGRGLSVLLCDQGDLGGATSSVSSKLLHGGLRYLEQYQFRMVRHALAEREVLLDVAPHVVSPLRFVLPHNRSIRPYWMVRLGILLYDHLARRNTLAGSQTLDFRSGRDPSPLKSDFERGFEYSDCWVDDARLVILTAIDARDRGAMILPRTACVSARWDGESWLAQLRDELTGKTQAVRARVAVNAAGPWAGGVSRQLGLPSAYSPRLVKGSHIVVPKLFEDDRAYILQNDDKRIVFVLPFERDYTLIGTTDIPFEGDPSSVRIDESEIDYLCGIANDHFVAQVTPDDIVWSFSGVRPLVDDGSSSVSKTSRDHMLEAHRSGDGSRLQAVTIWGGKLTGYRLLAEDVMARLKGTFPLMADPWTVGAKLPGGDLHPGGIDRFTRMLTQVFDWLPPALADSYARRYGSLSHSVLGNSSSLKDLGDELSAGLFSREIDYLIRNEWAYSVDDILWRRTKLGLRASEDDRQRLDDYLKHSSAAS